MSVVPEGSVDPVVEVGTVGPARAADVTVVIPRFQGLVQADQPLLSDRIFYVLVGVAFAAIAVLAAAGAYVLTRIFFG